MTFIDSNILLDVAHEHSAWCKWSEERLRERAALGPLKVNEIVYAEVSASFADEAATDLFFDTLGVVMERTVKSALILAARAHIAYRRDGGTRTGVLPDFFIGAHAALAGLPLLTRDPRRYRAYFPTLQIIAP